MSYASISLLSTALFVAAGAGVPSIALAQDAVQEAIAPQPLADALEQWALRYGKQLMFDENLAAGVRTEGVAGGLPDMEALARLLDGTGLDYRVLNERTISILPQATNTARTRPGEVAKTQNVSGEISAAQDAALRLAQTESSVDAGQSSSARSQDASTAGEPVPGLDEIVVTAQKRKERLIDTPQSVSVLSADALAKMGATQFRDFATPSRDSAFRPPAQASRKWLCAA